MQPVKLPMRGNREKYPHIKNCSFLFAAFLSARDKTISLAVFLIGGKNVQLLF